MIILSYIYLFSKYFKNDDKEQKNSNHSKSYKSRERLTAEQIGEIGERTVKEKILRELNPNERMLNNYITYGESSQTSQIDHIVIKPAGVFVIETKNYEGKIYGKRTELKWTQVLAGGKVTNEFYNPVKQNETHIKNIKKFVGEKTPIYSMVVFLKGDINSIAWIEEIYTPHRMMMKFQYTANERKISDEEILQIYNNLKEHRLYISDHEHIDNVKSYLNDTNKNK